MRCTSALWNVVRWTSDSGHHSTCRPPTWLPTWLTPPCWPWPHPKGMTFMASKTLMCEDLVREGGSFLWICVCLGWWFEITSRFARLAGLPLGVLWHVMKNESALRSRQGKSGYSTQLWKNIGLQHLWQTAPAHVTSDVWFVATHSTYASVNREQNCLNQDGTHFF